MRRKITGLHILFCLTAVSGIFSILIILMDTSFIDINAQRLFQLQDITWINQFLNVSTSLAATTVMTVLSLLIIVLFMIKRYHYLNFLFITIMSGGVILTVLMKVYIQRERPGEITYLDFFGFGADIISYSYPSGHAVKGLLFFGFLIFLIKRMKAQFLKSIFSIMLVTVILLIGIGQIYLDKHFLTDVIGGYLISSTWIMFCFTVIYPKLVSLELSHDTKNKSVIRLAQRE